MCALAHSSPDTVGSWELTVWRNPWLALGAVPLRQDHFCNHHMIVPRPPKRPASIGSWKPSCSGCRPSSPPRSALCTGLCVWLLEWGGRVGTELTTLGLGPGQEQGLSQPVVSLCPVPMLPGRVRSWSRPPGTATLVAPQAPAACSACVHWTSTLLVWAASPRGAWAEREGYWQVGVGVQQSLKSPQLISACR